MVLGNSLVSLRGWLLVTHPSAATWVVWISITRSQQEHPESSQLDVTPVYSPGQTMNWWGSVLALQTGGWMGSVSSVRGHYCDCEKDYSGRGRVEQSY